jgi:U3 small nucleolar RNA-associated protein 3
VYTLIPSIIRTCLTSVDCSSLHLTRRRKDLKNPRKKHRVKFAQAVVRRKGQVQGVQAAPSAPRGYAGEATGIKSKIAKSTRLG